MYTEIKAPQRSDEWYNARAGLITASNFSSILTHTGKPSSTQIKVIANCVKENIKGIVEEEQSFKSLAMIRGASLELEAFEFANQITELNFRTCGFLDSGLGYGASPDGINEELGIGLEIKCPEFHNHVETLLNGDMPKAHWQQVQGCMLVTGFKKWVFISYSDDIESFIKVIDRDDEYINKLKEQLLSCAEKIKEITEKYS
jgi:hypothetical protein